MFSRVTNHCGRCGDRTFIDDNGKCPACNDLERHPADKLVLECNTCERELVARIINVNKQEVIYKCETCSVSITVKVKEN